MHHIRKESWMGCAVAAGAMLTDSSYEEVAAHRPGLDAGRSRWPPKQFRALLESLTHINWRLRRCWFRCRHVHQFPFPDWPVAVFIQNRKRRPRFGQWIVVKRNIVHDPGMSSACLLNTYQYREWFISWIAQPKRPIELANYISRNRHLKVITALQSLSLVD